MVRAGAGRLACATCARPFGSPVAFCPFCGAAVAKAPAAKATAAAATPPPAQAAPPPVQATPPPATSPAPGPASPPPRASVPLTPPTPWHPIQPAAPRAARRVPWRWLAAGAALVLFAFFMDSRGPGVPDATLTVLVSTPAGATVSGGDVLIDGRRTGAPGQALSVRPGTLGVRFELPGYTSDAKSVSVAGGVALQVALIAKPLPAKLNLTSNPPAATVTIAGRTLGRTPLSLDLPPQTHTVNLTLAGFLRKSLDVSLDPGKTRTLGVDLNPVPPPPSRTAAPQPAPFDRGVVTAQVPLFAVPSRGGNLLTSLPPDTEVAVLAQVSADETWLQVRAAGAQGFLPAAEGVESWEAWARRHAGSGPLDSVTPDLRAVVGSASYPLFGIRPPPQGSRSLASQREALRRELGGKSVTCAPKTTTRYVCTIAPEGDLAGYYLFNGAAMVGDGATAYDLELQEWARSRHKGAWGE